MKRFIAAALVLFGGAGLAWANLSSPSSAVASNVEQGKEEARPLRAYHVTKADPLTLSSTMDSPGVNMTPYMAPSSGRYGEPQGPILTSSLSGAWRASVVSEAAASQEKSHWGHKK